MRSNIFKLIKIKPLSLSAATPPPVRSYNATLARPSHRGLIQAATVSALLVELNKRELLYALGGTITIREVA